MKRRSVWMVLALVFAFSFLVVKTASAAVEEGKTTRGELALYLIKQAGLASKLSPAATGKDAMDFLTGLGIAPEGGWGDPNTKIDLAFVQSLLPEGTSAATLEDALAAAVQAVADTVGAQSGVSRVQAEGTSGSQPAS